MSKTRDTAKRLELFAAYLTLDGQERRATAYELASETLLDADHIPADPANLDGIGPSIRETISEYERTGSIEELEELRDAYPWFAELREIDGVGPSMAKRLYDAGIESVGDVVEADEDLEEIHGVGEARRSSIVESAKGLST